MLYDRLVRHKTKEGAMISGELTKMQQIAQVLATRLVSEPGAKPAIRTLTEDLLGDALFREQDLSDPTRCQQTLVELFMAVRAQLQATPAAPCLAPLSQALQGVAAQCGVPTEGFYAALLGRLFGGTEACSLGQATPKLSTKEKILDAALEVFSEKGFHVATVDEIAEQAGLGKGTVYRYFANKEALFHDLVRIRLEDLEERAIGVLDSQDDVVAMIIKYLRVYFDFFDHNQRLYRVIVQERLDFGNEMQELYIKKVLRRLPALKRKVYGGTQQGVFKDVDFQTVFYGVMGFVHGVFQKWLAHDCSYSLMDELPTVVEILFFGFVKDQSRAAWHDLRNELAQTRAFS
jgi:AcrR family transcriptional regulator